MEAIVVWTEDTTMNYDSTVLDPNDEDATRQSYEFRSA